MNLTVIQCPECGKTANASDGFQLRERVWHYRDIGEIHPPEDAEDVGVITLFDCNEHDDMEPIKGTPNYQIWHTGCGPFPVPEGFFDNEIDYR